ncbi:MAG TPA: shikimate kinase [Tepidisphaeraceae bacterium]|nr:shikimate kinase [Tepidisphaeraceae bacterium]
MSVGLIGYRGSGKTTIGKRLADRLWQPFIDIDDLVIKKAGKSIKEIFEQEGEQRFRDLETEVVREVCTQPDTVIAFGGGALDRDENREAIKQAGLRLIYFKCEPAELLKRIQNDPETAANRPALSNLGGSIEEIESVLARREPIWRSIAAAELEVTYLTPEDAVPYVVRLM